MKHLKTLGLAAVAAMALMAFVGAGTVSATVICETTPAVGSPCPAGWHWSTGSTGEWTSPPNSTFLVETTEGGAGTTCRSAHITWTSSNTGSSTQTKIVSSTKEKTTYTECTNPVNVLTGGELEFHSIAGTHNATVTAKGYVVTVVTFGFHCAYGAGTGIDLGTFTPGAGGTDGTLVVNTIVQRVSSHNGTNFSIFCPATARWTGSFTQVAHNGVETPAYITAG